MREHLARERRELEQKLEALAAQLAQVAQERDEALDNQRKTYQNGVELVKYLGKAEAALAAVRAQLQQVEQERDEFLHNGVAKAIRQQAESELAAVRAACQQLRERWIKEADALDAVWAPRFGEGYPETDYAIEAKQRRQCAFQLAALDALGEPKAE